MVSPEHRNYLTDACGQETHQTY